MISITQSSKISKLIDKILYYKNVTRTFRIKNFRFKTSYIQKLARKVNSICINQTESKKMNMKYVGISKGLTFYSISILKTVTVQRFI